MVLVYDEYTHDSTISISIASRKESSTYYITHHMPAISLILCSILAFYSSIALQPCQIVTNRHPTLIYWPFHNSNPHRKVFLHMGWGSFLSSLQGPNDDVSLQFYLRFDGRFARIGSLVFSVSQESIALAMKFP
jgi:hypothetical protein